MIKKLISAVLCVMLALTTTTACLAGSAGYSVEAAVNYETPYYYYQLSDNAKTIYNKIKPAVLECKKQVKMDIQMEEEDFDKVSELLMLHDPVTFNVADFQATTTTYTLKNSKTTTVTFNIKYKYSKETFDKMVAAYEKKVDNILSKLKGVTNTYQKIRIIHDEIVKNTVYDLESSANDTIYGALVKQKGKCDGYAKSFSYICAKAGIRTVTVIGNAARDGVSELHMWNKVYYNNKWYNVDATWDDPVSNQTPNNSHDYFMISDAAISRSHVESNLSFEVPKAGDNSINYYKVNKRFAGDLDSAKNLISTGLASAVKNKAVTYEFQCSSKSVFDEVQKYVTGSGNINSVLKNIRSNTGTKVAASIYSYGFNEEQYTVKIMIFYENTSIDNYFSDTDSIGADMLNSLAKLGIK